MLSDCGVGDVHEADRPERAVRIDQSLAVFGRRDDLRRRRPLRIHAVRQIAGDCETGDSIEHPVGMRWRAAVVASAMLNVARTDLRGIRVLLSKGSTSIAIVAARLRCEGCGMPNAASSPTAPDSVTYHFASNPGASPRPALLSTSRQSAHATCTKYLI